MSSERKKVVKEFAEDASLLMLAAALVHQHNTGDVPFPPNQALRAFNIAGKHIQELRKLEKPLSPIDTGKAIAERLINHLATKRCKGLAMPTPAFMAWLAFLPGGGKTKLPIQGQIPLETSDGDKFVLHIEVDSKGEGSIYRYHDPESDSTIIGREVYMDIGGE